MSINKGVVIGIAVALLLLTGLAGCTGGVLRGPVTGEEKAFLASLRGEIVYAQADDRHYGYYSIYQINANGTNKRLLYRNDRPEYNLSCFNPLWSEDGTKIYFTAMKDDKWRKFVMDADGSNVELVENEDPYLVTVKSREPDIIVKEGSIFWQDAEGQLHEAYHFPFYVADFRNGAYLALWSPDKKFIIFVLWEGKNNILIANKEGTIVIKITEGIDPDWKY
jgi:Tol biopolymer transport system component